jgi:lipoprotein NlpD
MNLQIIRSISFKFIVLSISIALSACATSSYHKNRTGSSSYSRVGNQKIVMETMPSETIQERILSGFSQTHRFQWPASGRLMRKYSLEKGSKGIDLKGLKGDPIYASSNGVVVFSGSALRGYGNLIIIKHDETFLTAYGHVGKLFVKERENVKVGRKIAEMGNDVSREVLLHFEIRKRGIPVDPLAYLSRAQIKI